jgi:hypothetical protein
MTSLRGFLDENEPNMPSDHDNDSSIMVLDRSYIQRVSDDAPTAETIIPPRLLM